MDYKGSVVALSMLVANLPAAAAQPEPAWEAGAPSASADARYCLRVEPITGSRIETIRCESREAWAQLGVDVDEEWREEGVRVVSSRGSN